MKCHFGTKPIKEWIDDNEWHQNFPSFNKPSGTEKHEICKALEQAASGTFLRV